MKVIREILGVIALVVIVAFIIIWIFRPAVLSLRSSDDQVMKAIIMVESNNNPNAVGSHGERGLCQIMPETWDFVCLDIIKKDYSFDRAFEQDINIEVGTAYYKYILGKCDNNSDTAIRAYNAGLHGAKDHNRGWSYLKKVKREITNNQAPNNNQEPNSRG
jgi:soluble lytic murein transglycosylase-like protein